MNLAATLGPHWAFIIAAYIAAVLVIAGLIAWVWLDHRAQKRQLDRLEARGVTRRSGRTVETPA